MKQTVKTIFLRMNRYGMLILCAAAMGLLCLGSRAIPIRLMLMGNPLSVVSAVDEFFWAGGQVFPIVFLICSIPAVSVFCQEWEHGYWKMSCVRTGGGRWNAAWLVCIGGSAFVICFSGLLLMLLAFGVICAVKGYPFYRPLVDIWMPMPHSPHLYVILQMAVFSMGAALWSVISCLVIVRFQDLFLALVMPVAFYSAIDYVMAVTVQLTLGSVLYMDIGTRPFVLAVIRSVACLAGLTGLLALWLSHVMNRRKNYEIDP